MGRLVVADLVANARVWVGALLIAAVAGGVGAVVAGDIAAASGAGGMAGLALYAITGTVVLFGLIAALVVLGSVTDLAVALHQRSYALWKLIGFKPGTVRAIVHAQLLVIALLGGLAGCLGTAPLLPALFRYSLASVPDFGTMNPRLGPIGVAGAVGGVVLIVLLGGARGARRASRVAALQALREPEDAARGMSAARWIAGPAAAAIAVSMIASLPGKTADRAAQPLILLAPLLSAVVAAFGPLLLARFLRCWTGIGPRLLSRIPRGRTRIPLLPGRLSRPQAKIGRADAVWWYLARRATAHHVTRSTGAVNPLMVAIALAGGLYAASGTTGGSGPSAGELVLLLGAPLLLSLLGAAVTVFMAGKRREQEVALLVAAGGTPGTLLAAAAAEAVIYVGTAVLLGGLPLLITGLAGGWALRVTPHFGIVAAGSVAVAGLVLTLPATVVPTLLALRADVVRTLAAE